MSDASDKPFEPTPGRLQKARREGNVARSTELAANCAFAAGAFGVFAIVPIFGAAAGAAITSAQAGRAEPAGFCVIIAMSLLPLGAAALGGVLGGAAQNGGLRFVSVTPKAERLNPFEGWKRIASIETLAHSARAALAFACATAGVAPFVAWSGAALVQPSTLTEVVAGTWLAVRQAAFAACAVGFFFAIAEHAAARKAWLRKLRMSLEERKRESKEEEGDAAARGRRRSLHRTLLRGGVRQLKDAAFVVANPQHVAVALQYRPPLVPVPRVLMRAAGAAAARVRAMADERGIPVVENVWLARALYRDGRPGQAIPVVHYVAVAEIVSALMRNGEIVSP